MKLPALRNIRYVHVNNRDYVYSDICYGGHRRRICWGLATNANINRAREYVLTVRMTTHTARKHGQPLPPLPATGRKPYVSLKTWRGIRSLANHARKQYANAVKMLNGDPYQFEPLSLSQQMMERKLIRIGILKVGEPVG